ncbi:hypothetical protein TWF970_010275 [Orbilia oligospora]|uniref:Phytanoyl-CoA dioxygenase n=1 Tax=Orbilia oligospora TaxID=2813651 RepID=A0A7C8RD47_ORBOL|nr:hypothetical protein TWF970_010275 [Orbilia oligospora]
MEPTLETGIPIFSIPEKYRKAGIYPQELLASSIKYLHASGVIVLENAIDVEHLDALNAVLAPQAKELANTPGRHFNFGVETGNINQAPPSDDDLMFPDIWANQFVMPTLATMLGPEPVLQYASGNTALQTPSNARQPVHSDIDFPHPNFPFSMVVNIPLVDMTIENGALEVWPGTHSTTFEDQILEPGQSGELPVRAIIPELLQLRKAVCPPVRVVVPKGSIIIRDLRLWHAGCPNFTPNPRVMLAFIWQAAWWCGRGWFELPIRLRSLLSTWENGIIKFRVAARWVEQKRVCRRQEMEESNLGSLDATVSGLF